MADLITRSLVLIAPGVALFYFIISYFFDRYHIYTESKRLGCKPVPLEPSYYPFGIDVLLKLLKADREERSPDVMIERYNSMGRYTWRTAMVGTEFFTTADPENIKAILATQFTNFTMGRARRGNLKPVFGNNIFAVDGEAWAHAREVLRPQFNRELVSDLNLEETHFCNMLQCFSVDPKTGWTQEVSLVEHFFRLTIDSATEFFLGQSIDSQLVRLREKKLGLTSQAHDFHWAFDRSQEFFARRLRFRGLYWLVGGAELTECIKVMHEFADSLITDAFKERSEKGWASPKYDFITSISTRTDNPKKIRDEILGLLIAGRDTTASLLSWVFYCFVRYPKVFKKLRSVILDEFGSYGEDTTKITSSSLKSCRYLQHVLNETLRLHAVIPFNSRLAIKDTVLPTGGGPNYDAPVFVPAGREVNYSVHVMHLRKDLWGPDAAEFLPERWERKVPAWQFLPFNGGPRLCLGQQFALIEAGYVIVRMLQKFDNIEGINIDPTRDWHHVRLACAPGPGGSGVRVRLHEAGR